EIVNRNHITGVSTTKSPELFAQFSDYLIKNYWVEREFERDLENFIFKRLVNGTSRSEDVENSLISKLKEIC
ncbi:17991_t:CDS:2, partial [Gigaspora rosea]